MDEIWPQIALIVVLVAVNDMLSGSEIALIPLREAGARDPYPTSSRSHRRMRVAFFGDDWA